MTRISALFLVCACLSLRGQDAAPENRYAAEVANLSEKSGLTFRFAETDHFVWAWTLPDAQVAPLHKVAEDAWKHFADSSGVTEYSELWKSQRGPEKCLFIITTSGVQHAKAIDWYAEKYKPWKGFKDAASSQSYYVSSAPRVASLIHLKPLSPSRLKYVIAHEIGHLVVQRYKFNNQVPPPWLEEAYATYLEGKTLGRTDCYCFQGTYGDTAKSLEKLTELEWKKWKEAVVDQAKKRKDKLMKGILPLSLSQLGSDEVGKSAAVIEWLLDKDKAKFWAFVASVKKAWPQDYQMNWTEQKSAIQDTALKDAFGFGLDTIDEEWRASFSARKK